jgi:septum site-determining protein MinC
LQTPHRIAVASSEPVAAVLELRSAALTLIAVVLMTTDLDVLAHELDQRALAMPGLFDDEPIAIDLSCVREAGEAPDLVNLIALFRRHRMLPVAVRGGNAEQMAAALAAGLIEAPEGARPTRELSLVSPVTLTESIVEVQVPALSPMLIERPLRSGQQVYARDRDLVVLSLVSYGAEVIADGSIHVYAPLRGRAIAGAKGNKEARIFTTAMEAQLLAIAGVYRTTDVALPIEVIGRAAMVRLAGNSLLVEPIQ